MFIYYLYNLFGTFSKIYVLSQIFTYIKNTLKNEDFKTSFNKLIINTSYNFIYIYSTCQIEISKIKNKINSYIESNPELKSFIKNNVKNKFYKNITLFKDNQTKKISYCELNELVKNNYFENNKYDLFIYSEMPFNSNSVVNKITFHDINELLKNIQNDEIVYENVGYKFIMFEIIIDDKIISINLSSEKYNYMILNNVIDKIFIKYFLLNEYNKQIDNSLILNQELNYKIKIIDDNINILQFDHNDKLIIKSKGIETLQNKQITETISVFKNDDDRINKSNIKINNVTVNNIAESKNYDNNYDNSMIEDFDCVEIINYKYN